MSEIREAVERLHGGLEPGASGADTILSSLPNEGLDAINVEAMTMNAVCVASIAISLKRLADGLELLNGGTPVCRGIFNALLAFAAVVAAVVLLWDYLK